jgi:hypothetical protein
MGQLTFSKGSYMTTRKVLAAALAALFILCALGFTFRQPPQPTWEYKQICTIKDPKKPDTELRDINQAGAEGWEMTGATTLFQSMACTYFKRQK